MKYPLSLSQEAIILFFVTTVFYVIDVFTAKNGFYSQCIGNVFFHLIQYFHHLVVTFVMLGWLSNSKKVLTLYVALFPLVVIHWFLNDGNCALTLIVNDMAKKSKDTFFRDVFYMCGLKNGPHYHYNYVIVVLLLIIACYRLFKKNK